MKFKLLMLVVLSLLLNVSAFAAVESSLPVNSSVSSQSSKASKTEAVNINTADVKAFSSLKGIGKKRAEAIIAYRNANGNFKSIEDLSKVKGISKKAVEENKARLQV
jgi:competence protein ComEA